MTSPGTLLDRAVTWAAHLHVDQTRKVSGAPYVAHLLGAAGIAATISADEVVLAAALLHDAIEDQQATAADAVANLGPERCGEVWAVVEKCTDVVDRKRYPTWRERKAAYLATLDELEFHRDPVFLRRVTTVALADKLYNARSIENELRTEGRAAFDRMAGGTESMTWYLPGLAERLERLAAMCGDQRVLALARDYHETVARIRTVYELLPELNHDLRIGRAADLAMGIKNLRVTGPRGQELRVDIALTPTRVTRAAARNPGLEPSRAARESARFADAISATATWALGHYFHQSGQSLGRLGHAFNAASVALEHGASTSEACSTMLVGLTAGKRAIAVDEAETVRRLGVEVGTDVYATLKGCNEFVPRSRQGVPVFGSRQKLIRTSRNALRRSVFTVLAADELPRAIALEDRLLRQPLDQALAHPPRGLAEVQSFAEASLREFDGTLATELADVNARIEVYFAVAEQLTVARLLEAGRSAGPYRLQSTEGEAFVFMSPDGSRYRADITVHPHPQPLLRRGRGEAIGLEAIG